MVDFIFKDISSFDEDFFESDRSISFIGTGSLGGKASGLVSISDILRSEINTSDFQSIEICIPKMVVILTDVFDSFMQENNLYETALSDASDDMIALSFQKANLPFRILGVLRTFISGIHSPLAIRSSSLLEDSLSMPFAGIYGTKMTPNNQHDVDTRFRKLTEAIKYVYASTYFRAAKDYIHTTKYKTEDEKMAVIIQEIAGSRYEDRFYPEISGVARSYNYYPTGHSKPEDGVVNLALGLGKTIVDGGFSWSYSPEYPKSGPPFNSSDDMIKNTQTEFWAVNMGAPPEYDPVSETEYMVQKNLSYAEEDGTLRHLVSTYDVDSDRFWTGLSGNGPRVLNFAPVLVAESFPLNKLIKTVLHVCENAVKSPVEIEFAVTLSHDVQRFGFLQLRPVRVFEDATDNPAEEAAGDRIFISSGTVLGNGMIDNITDIVYADIPNPDAKISYQVASEVEMFNRKLVNENRPYLMIGYGRWGTSDPAAGIPVRWQQISGVKVIVEVSVRSANVEMSQGSHFFHNLTSFRVIYFSLPAGTEIIFDRCWLSNQIVVEEMKYTKHIRTKGKLLIKADGRTGRGEVLKPIEK
ncbi:MAG: hypothetical protein JW723_04055 [Bacteroidales bacterium]|nr:hypothetical protein [Bacteroidales bacterium]